MAGRRLGQHFLIKQSILARIAKAASPYPDKPVIEIGPGKGALTEHLVKAASQVHAIELDQVLVQYLPREISKRTQFFRGARRRS